MREVSSILHTSCYLLLPSAEHLSCFCSVFGAKIMVIFSKAELDQISLPNSHESIYNFPAVDLSEPGAGSRIVKACEELGFFKVTRHGIPTELVERLEAEAVKFFGMPQMEKEKATLCGYGRRRIGCNGDVGRLEYLMVQITSDPMSLESFAFLAEPSASFFRSALEEYVSAVRKLACQILELMAEGLSIEPRNTLSKLAMNEESDSAFRLNHYPLCPILNRMDRVPIDFGEHTDPQIISALRSNNTSGLQISLRDDGSWVSVPPDRNSFFINVGDSLQVLTNGRFRSVKHRVLANRVEPRLSMIYFVGPPSRERLVPLPSLIKEGEQSLYREFTWCEYKRLAYRTRLAENRLGRFEKQRGVHC
uniref:gibberellin 2beta-dioxygenase n=1 Tax=Paris polyphylla var. yunnanensis TaxID=221260 RepID=A0A2P1NRE1_PARPY|nr:GA2ox1 [Paris polyphylla var. yunnanensis]